jgi:hypothetical protein
VVSLLPLDELPVEPLVVPDDVDDDPVEPVDGVDGIEGVEGVDGIDVAVSVGFGTSLLPDGVVGVAVLGAVAAGSAGAGVDGVAEGAGCGAWATCVVPLWGCVPSSCSAA